MVNRDSSIFACLACTVECEICATVYMTMDGHGLCVKVCRDCADICTLCARLCARDCQFSDAICEVCVQSCLAVVEEYDKHTDQAEHADCFRKCAEACLRCAEACKVSSIV
jgi:hypothetical protein